MCVVMGFTKTEMSTDQARVYLDRCYTRGPDGGRIFEIGTKTIGFLRLSIMGLSENGMQPFMFKDNVVACNGELYGFRRVKDELIRKGYRFKSESDCEILLPLYEEYGLGMFERLDAEFALVLYDGKKDKLIAARDPIGIRPLYYGESKKTGEYIFASEAKMIVDLVKRVLPFPPGYYYDGEKFVKYYSVTDVEESKDNMETVLSKIHNYLEDGVNKRLDSDAPLGFLLSGGLDSSLVCSIATKTLQTPIRTFAIGMDLDPIDLKYAKEVADFIHSEHHEYRMTREEVLSELDNLIYLLGTYDITTIRASLGMYILCKKIHETTDVKVLMTGEISDELFGYKYTDFAPSKEEFQKEAVKRIEEIHQYDVLRADRCISSNSIEGRVPFGDLKFAKYVMSIDPSLKMNTYGKGKYLLRKAFDDGTYLPHDILFREKAAFSDAVGHSMVDDLKEYAEEKYTDEEFEILRKKYTHATPFTKESLLYREIFEKYYPSQSQMVVDFWMPNKTWPGCDVNDPSARVLKNYGDSAK